MLSPGKIIAGIIGLFMFFMMIAIAKIPMPVSPPPAKAEEIQEFDHQWQSTAPLLLREKMVPKIVRVIPLVPDKGPEVAIVEPEVVVDEPPIPQPRASIKQRHRKVSSFDICRGKGKQWYDNNRRWRCKRK